jgi:hypothetical protein
MVTFFHNIVVHCENMFCFAFCFSNFFLFFLKSLSLSSMHSRREEGEEKARDKEGGTGANAAGLSAARARMQDMITFEGVGVRVSDAQGLQLKMEAGCVTFSLNNFTGEVTLRKITEPALTPVVPDKCTLTLPAENPQEQAEDCLSSGLGNISPHSASSCSLSFGLTPTPMTTLNSPPEKKKKLSKDTSLQSAPAAGGMMTGAPPLGRWAHSATIVSGGRMVVMGGQADSEAQEATLGDVHTLDITSMSWSKPLNCEGAARSWHSAVFLPQKGQLLVFGGERANVDLVETLADAMVLDAELMLLYEPAVSGRAPTARTGHSCSTIGNDVVVMFGGSRGRKWQANLAVLDTNRWHWRNPPAVSGNPPAPRSYHTATTVGGSSMVVFGGNNATDTFNDVVVLRTEGTEGWVWNRPVIVGIPPKPRTGHIAVLLEDGYSILIQGGWDPDHKDGVIYYSDCFVLNTQLWEWSLGPSADSTEDSMRVGHTGVLVCGDRQCWSRPAGTEIHPPNSSRVLIFGGQDSRGTRRDDIICLDVSRYAPPPPPPPQHASPALSALS